MQNTIALNDQLIDAIRNSVQDETILNAFRMVPRHLFVPTFFDREHPTSRKWRPISSTANEKEWLGKVYTNQPLIISFDADGYPTSSSSQPDIMAKMIQSIQLQRGHRVLEVGTGTGYNAAILGWIVDPGNVVTIDINGTLLDGARMRIEQAVGPGVTVLHSDGRDLPESLGLFDAIIVTGSAERIDPSWIRALAPGGRIVLNWIKSFIKVMIEAEKTGVGLVGHVCNYSGDFMGLHDGQGIQRQMFPYERLVVVEKLAFQSQIESTNFRFFLQINRPSLRHCYYIRPSSGEKVYIVKETKSNRVVQFFPTEIRGDASLWGDISAIAKCYTDLLRPHATAFSLSVDAEATMTFHHHSLSFSVM